MRTITLVILASTLGCAAALVFAAYLYYESTKKLSKSKEVQRSITNEVLECENIVVYFGYVCVGNDECIAVVPTRGAELTAYHLKISRNVSDEVYNTGVICGRHATPVMERGYYNILIVSDKHFRCSIKHDRASDVYDANLAFDDVTSNTSMRNRHAAMAYELGLRTDLHTENTKEIPVVFSCIERLETYTCKYTVFAPGSIELPVDAPTYLATPTKPPNNCLVVIWPIRPSTAYVENLELLSTTTEKTHKVVVYKIADLAKDAVFSTTTFGRVDTRTYPKVYSSRLLV